MRFIKLILLSLFVYACVSEPEFALEPFIEYRSIEQLNFPGFDSVTIEISFQDGDGDLGLSSADTLQHGAWERNPNGSLKLDENGERIPNPFFFNYFLEVLREENGTFVPVIFPDILNFNGRYPVLNTLGNETALEGELKFSFEFLIDIAGSPISRGDKIKFQVEIADRAKNLSNVVETEEIIAGEPFVPSQGDDE